MTIGVELGSAETTELVDGKIAEEEMSEDDSEASEDVTELRTWVEDAEFVNEADELGTLLDERRLEDMADEDVADAKVEEDRSTGELETEELTWVEEDTGITELDAEEGCADDEALEERADDVLDNRTDEDMAEQVPNPGWQPVPQYADVEPLLKGISIGSS